MGETRQPSTSNVLEGTNFSNRQQSMQDYVAVVVRDRNVENKNASSQKDWDRARGNIFINGVSTDPYFVEIAKNNLAAGDPNRTKKETSFDELNAGVELFEENNITQVINATCPGLDKNLLQYITHSSHQGGFLQISRSCMSAALGNAKNVAIIAPNHHDTNQLQNRYDFIKEQDGSVTFVERYFIHSCRNKSNPTEQIYPSAANNHLAMVVTKYHISVVNGQIKHELIGEDEVTLLDKNAKELFAGMKVSEAYGQSNDEIEKKYLHDHVYTANPNLFKSQFEEVKSTIAQCPYSTVKAILYKELGTSTNEVENLQSKVEYDEEKHDIKKMGDIKKQIDNFNQFMKELDDAVATYDGIPSLQASITSMHNEIKNSELTSYQQLADMNHKLATHISSVNLFYQSCHQMAFAILTAENKSAQEIGNNLLNNIIEERKLTLTDLDRVSKELMDATQQIQQFKISCEQLQALSSKYGSQDLGVELSKVLANLQDSTMTTLDELRSTNDIMQSTISRVEKYEKLCEELEILINSCHNTTLKAELASKLIELKNSVTSLDDLNSQKKHSTINQLQNIHDQLSTFNKVYSSVYVNRNGINGHLDTCKNPSLQQELRALVNDKFLNKDSDIRSSELSDLNVKLDNDLGYRIGQFNNACTDLAGAIQNCDDQALKQKYSEKYDQVTSQPISSNEMNEQTRLLKQAYKDLAKDIDLSTENRSDRTSKAQHLGEKMSKAGTSLIKASIDAAITTKGLSSFYSAYGIVLGATVTAMGAAMTAAATAARKVSRAYSNWNKAASKTDIRPANEAKSQAVSPEQEQQERPQGPGKGR